MATRVCVDLYRTRIRCDEPAGWGGPVEASDPADAVASRLYVQQILDGLSPRDRQFLGMIASGVPLAVVARRLRVTATSVRVGALRARRRAQAVVAQIERGALGVLGLSPCRHLADRTRSVLRRRGQALATHPAIIHLQNEAASLLVIALGFLPATAAGSVGVLAASPRQPGSVRSPQSAGGQLVPAALALNGQARGWPSVSAGAAQRGLGASADPSGVGSGPGTAPGFGSSDVASTATGGAPSGPIGSGVLPGTPAPGTGPTKGLLPPPEATQYDAAFSSMTASSDGTTLASGMLMSCTATCSTVFRSTDLGHSWQRLPSQGFTGGRILLPPSYPADGTIFAVGGGGLQESDDGGNLFRTVNPAPVPASIDPRSPSGDARIALGSMPLTFLDQRTGLISPGPLLPPGMKNVSDVAFTAPGDLVVAGAEVSPTARGQQAAVVLLCAAGATSCAVVSTPPTASSFTLSVPTSPTATHLVTMVGADRLYVSEDDGYHFQGGRVAGLATVGSATPSADYGSTGTLIVAGDDAAFHAILLRGPIGALTRISPQGLPSDAVLDQVLELPGGRLLGAMVFPDEVGRFGIRTSDDGGYTWGTG